MAKGIDTSAWNYGKKYKIDLIEMPAEWEKYKRPNGKNPAGMIRNAEMGKIADCLIAFWDLKSPGTKNMIDIATAKGIPIYLVVIPTGEIKCRNIKNNEDKISMNEKDLEELKRKLEIANLPIVFRVHSHWQLESDFIKDQYERRIVNSVRYDSKDKTLYWISIKEIYDPIQEKHIFIEVTFFTPITSIKTLYKLIENSFINENLHSWRYTTLKVIEKNKEDEYYFIPKFETNTSYQVIIRKDNIQVGKDTLTEFDELNELIPQLESLNLYTS